MIFTLDGQLRLTDCPAALRRKLMDELTVQNPAYVDALRLGRPTWGIPRELLLYKVDNNELILPRGMAMRVWQDRPRDAQRRDAMTLLPASDWPESGIALRVYQQQAADNILHNRIPQGVLVMPCGAGKTETGLYIIHRLGQPALWIAHTKDLVQQTFDRARERLGLTGDQLGMLCGGVRRLGTHLTVATVQTLYHMELDELAGKFGTVVVDECQHVVNNPTNAEMFNRVLAELPARYRYGLTASPGRGDGLEHTIYQILGDPLYTVDQRTLGEAGSVITPTVQPVYTGFTYEPSGREAEHIDVNRLRSFMAADKNRRELLFSLIEKELCGGHTCLVLGCTLGMLGILNDHFSMRWKSRFICGSTKQQERAAALKELREGGADVLFATYQLAKEGLDIPRADRLILAQPVRDSVAVQQSVGRIMRPAPGKTDAVVLDLVDVAVPSCKSQYSARRRVYKKLQANILKEENYNV